MSTDWLPRDAEGARVIPSHVYTEPVWTRTVKGVLKDRRENLKHLYDIFDKKEGTVILAEGESMKNCERYEIITKFSSKYLC